MTKDKDNKFVFYVNNLSYKSVNGAKGKERWVEGYISTDDLDLVNDIVTQSCMDSMEAQFGMRVIKLDFEHETMRGNTPADSEYNKTRIPLGKPGDRERDAKGLKISWKLNDNWKKFDEKGNITMTMDEVWGNIEDGYYDAFSIAYVPTKISYIEKDGETIRLLDDLNLLNVALTGNPINPGASMTAVMMKSLDYMKAQVNPDPNDLSLLEVKSEIDSLRKKMSQIETHVGCKTMTEKKDETPAEGAPAPEGAAPEAGTETPAAGSEAGATPPAEAPAEAGDAAPGSEGKAGDLGEIKSMLKGFEARMTALEKTNATLDKIVGKAQQKGKGAENNTDKGDQIPEGKSAFKGPLDMIN